MEVQIFLFDDFGGDETNSLISMISHFVSNLRKYKINKESGGTLDECSRMLASGHFKDGVLKIEGKRTEIG